MYLRALVDKNRTCTGNSLIQTVSSCWYGFCGRLVLEADGRTDGRTTHGGRGPTTRTATTTTATATTTATTTTTATATTTATTTDSHID